MARYQAILAYDGAGYAGFQRQAAQGGGTVQAAVEAALRQIGWQGRTLLGAGRTDSGVHASGQVIAFDLEWKHSPESLRAALNANLPPDVAVMSARVTRPDFHPRFDALARRYRYSLFCQDGRNPLRERYSWRVWPEADVERMNAAAAMLLGEHDFAAFGAPPRPGSSTVRTVYQAHWRPGAYPGEKEFEISANAFLYHMVRRVVYLLVAIGQGRAEAEVIRKVLAAPEEMGTPAYAPLQGLAPPQGLCLTEVLYPEDVHLRRSPRRERETEGLETRPDLDDE